MDAYEEDSAELRLGHGYLQLTPVDSDPHEQDARVRFNVTTADGELRGEIFVMYLNMQEFAAALRDVHIKGVGKAELNGHAGFHLSIDVQSNGAAVLQFRSEGRPEENFELSLCLRFEQSHLPDFLRQLAAFNRSSAYKSS